MREIILAFEIEIAWRCCSQRVNHGVCTLDSTKIRINWWRKARKQFFFPFRIPSKRFPLEKKRIRHKIYIKRATAGRRREPRMADLWKKKKKKKGGSKWLDPRGLHKWKRRKFHFARRSPFPSKLSTRSTLTVLCSLNRNIELRAISVPRFHARFLVACVRKRLKPSRRFLIRKERKSCASLENIWNEKKMYRWFEDM